MYVYMNCPPDSRSMNEGYMYMPVCISEVYSLGFELYTKWFFFFHSCLPLSTELLAPYPKVFVTFPHT